MSACKTLVIDASIARAAGGKEARYPASVHARDFLQTVLDAHHKIGMTPAIKEEWDRHQSYFSQKWRRTMVAKKRFDYKYIMENVILREMIQATEASENNKSAMLKDCHLLEAALGFDKRVASSDDTVHRLFVQACVSINFIRNIIWVNPIAHAEIAESVKHWLEQGADDVTNWHLYDEESSVK